MMLKRTICCTVCVCLIICALLARGIGETSLPAGLYTTTEDRTFIKWVDFHASYEAMSCALELDIQSYEQDVRINWIDLLAYAAAKNGGSFPSSAVSDVRSCAQSLKDGKTMEELTQNLKYYRNYKLLTLPPQYLLHLFLAFLQQFLAVQMKELCGPNP